MNSSAGAKLSNVGDLITRGRKRNDDLYYHRTLPSISTDLARMTKGWPRRVGGRLFRLDDDNPIFIDNTAALFAWLHAIADVHWSSVPTYSPDVDSYFTPPAKSEFFAHLNATSTPNYDSIETLPHHPPLPNSFYIPSPLPTSTGDAWKEFRAHLNAETEGQKDLMMAALATPGWGGPPGCRPAFLFKSEYGYGVGKSSTAELICKVWNGAVDLNEKDSWETMSRALMNDKQIGRRTVMIDNLKTHLDISGLESLITASDASGHILFSGYHKRPNHFTVYLTSNTPLLSRDLIDRTVILDIGPRPGARHRAWKQWAVDFLQDNRLHLIADILAHLARSPRHVLPDHMDRWAPWQLGVLATFDEPNKLATLIAHSRKEAVARLHKPNRLRESS